MHALTTLYKKEGELVEATMGAIMVLLATQHACIVARTTEASGSSAGNPIMCAMKHNTNWALPYDLSLRFRGSSTL
jgi:hypothetical protein